MEEATGQDEEGVWTGSWILRSRVLVSSKCLKLVPTLLTNDVVVP
jgi:hypothetical protein